MPSGSKSIKLVPLIRPVECRVPPLTIDDYDGDVEKILASIDGDGVGTVCMAKDARASTIFSLRLIGIQEKKKESVSL